MNEERTIYCNGQIYTMDPEAPQAEAVMVRGTRIEAVGSLDDLGSLGGPELRRVDLEGQTLLPGMNDCHCHILSFGQSLRHVNVSPDHVPDVGQLLSSLRHRIHSTPAGAWVIGAGYNQNLLHERRHPTRAELDTVSPDHPIVVHHASGHVLACNSRALSLAGVTSNTPSPAGGEIERDQHGEPTGLMKETAMDLITSVIPPPTREQGAADILRAMQVMASQGVTSASDAATGAGDSIEPALAMYRTAAQSDELTGRITLMPQVAYVVGTGESHVRTPTSFDLGGRPEWLMLGPVKIFSDGALTTRTAALRHPYADGAANFGIPIWETGMLRETVRRAHVAGWQIATHAIGDRAVEMTLDAYEAALSAAPRANHRHRIEHCMVVDEALAQRISKLRVVPVVQPGFIPRLGDAYVTALGLERASGLMPVGLLERLRVPVAFSSDRPVIPGLPLQGIAAAIRRQTPEGVLLGEEHNVPALQAIRNYTTRGAYATHHDTIKGMLRPGHLADLVCLSDDPAHVPADEIASIRVTRTVTAGREVFRA